MLKYPSDVPTYNIQYRLGSHKTFGKCFQQIREMLGMLKIPTIQYVSQPNKHLVKPTISVISPFANTKTGNKARSYMKYFA
jgi:hypothetical protein